jgi:hypothetical protein
MSLDYEYSNKIYLVYEVEHILYIMYYKEEVKKTTIYNKI